MRVSHVSTVAQGDLTDLRCDVDDRNPPQTCNLDVDSGSSRGSYRPPTLLSVTDEDLNDGEGLESQARGIERSVKPRSQDTRCTPSPIPVLHANLSRSCKRLWEDLPSDEPLVSVKVLKREIESTCASSPSYSPSPSSPFFQEASLFPSFEFSFGSTLPLRSNDRADIDMLPQDFVSDDGEGLECLRRIDWAKELIRMYPRERRNVCGFQEG